MAESAVRQAVPLSSGSVRIVRPNRLVGSIVTPAPVMLFWPLVSVLLGKARAQHSGVSPADNEGGRTCEFKIS
jgi:hypothetical protein